MARNFICPLTGKECDREDCTSIYCVGRQLEEEAFREAQAKEKQRRMRAWRDPVTGKVHLRGGTLEDWGL